MMLMNFDSYRINEYDDMVDTLHNRGSSNYALKKLDLDLKNKTTPPTRQSIEEPTIMELKALPHHLGYVFLGANSTLTMIVAVDLVETEAKALLLVMLWFKGEIGWTIADIIRILPTIWTHKV